MLPVLWMILKILLIVLASILGLALFLLLLVLFVPIRYTFYMEKQEDFFLKGRISWLFGFLQLPVGYENAEFSAKLKILFFTWKDFFAKEEEIKEGAREIFSEEKEPEKNPASSPPANAAKKRKETDEAIEIKIPKEPKQEKPISPKPAPKKKNGKLKKLRYTLHSFYVKMKRLKRFATDERTKAAVSKGKEQLEVLLKKLFPKKISGNLHFGTEDPALTGEILGGLALFYPLYQDQVRIEPDFYEKVLEGKLGGSGSIRMVTLLGIAWKLYRDPNVRFVYRMVS